MSWGAIGFALSLDTGSLFGLVCDVYGALAFLVLAFSVAYRCGFVSVLMMGESECEYTSSGSPCRR